MSDDHLDKETSVSVDLTETGVAAKAKSRLVAAIDRLGGNLLELMNAPMERRISRERAITAGEKRVIEAVVEHGVDRLQHDPEFAKRVAEKHFGKLFIRQENKDGVILEAIEDLRHEPLTDEEARSGNSELDPQFVDRFERYAEDASTAELKQRWGRVLSAEIRKPGSFSPKVLRIIDEIERPTAEIFERVCKSLLANVLPKSIVGELSFAEVSSLTSAGLLVEPGLGQVRSFEAVRGRDDVERWMINLGEYGVVFLKDTVIKQPGLADIGQPEPPIVLDELKKPAMPVYVLTEAGMAVAQILPNHRREALLNLGQILRSYLPSAEIVELEVDLDLGGYVVLKRPPA